LLVPQVERLIRAKPSSFWLSALEREGVPCGPINTIEQVFSDPQIQHRGMKMQMPHPQAGEVSLVSNPVRFNNQPLNADTPPPGLGEHTEQVLAELLPERVGEFSELRLKGVIR
jgi:crotonobetainyl-CoA:carnitine CoA-transferase CaiB-like acyl-CoA transferase